VWQHSRPDRVVEALGLMVHQERGVEEALEHVGGEGR
jgi:fructose-bisphosphate aldolase, class I